MIFARFTSFFPSFFLSPRFFSSGDVTDSVEAGALSLNPNHIDIYTSSWGPNDDGRTIEGPAARTQQVLIDGVTSGRSGKGSIYLFVR